MQYTLIRDILTSPTGSFGFVVAILGLAFWLVHFVTKKTTHIASDHSVLTKSIVKVETTIDDMRKDLSYLKGTIDVIRKDSKPLSQSFSPVSLTDFGKQIAEELQATNIISKNWDKIYKILEHEICNKNAYDIQEYCKETAAVQPEKFFNFEDLNKIKDFAFKQGNNLQYYSIIFALLIRDKYFEVKGINLDDIDKHTPKTT